jgi:DNA-binding transcriptional regulator YiaG
MRRRFKSSTMNRDILTIKHLECSADHSSLRRALAARLDRALKRAGVSSAKAAKWLGVSEDEVQFWRRGITVPELHYFVRLANFLQLDVHWLCTGQTQAA